MSNIKIDDLKQFNVTNKKKTKKSGMGKIFVHSTVNRERKTDADQAERQKKGR